MTTVSMTKDEATKLALALLEATAYIIKLGFNRKETV